MKLEEVLISSMKILTLLLLFTISIQAQTTCNWNTNPACNSSSPFAITAGISSSTGVFVPTNYTSGFTPPAKGSSFIDPIFGTTVTRLTDGWTDVPNGSYTGIYSQQPQVNVNDTRMMIVNPIAGGVYVISLSTYAITNSLGIGDSQEPIWDNNDPDIIWYNSGNQIKKYNCSTNVHTTVATFNGTGGFPNYTNIDFEGGDADISEDGDHLGITGDDRYLQIYKISTNEVGPVLDTGTDSNIIQYQIMPDNYSSVDYNTTGAMAGTVAISTLNANLVGTGTNFLTSLHRGSTVFISGSNYTITSITSNILASLDSNGAVTASGLTATRFRHRVLYDKNWNFVRVVNEGFGGHDSWGRNPADGHQVHLIYNSNDISTPPVGCENSGVIMIDLNTGIRSCFVGFPDFNLTGHVAFANVRGSPWAAIGVYDGRVSSLGTAKFNSILRSDWAAAGVWKKFYNEIFIKNIVTGEIRRIVHHRTRLPGVMNYWFTPRASISKDSSLITFGSPMQVYHHKTGFGFVSTTSGSPTITGSLSPDALFFANVSSICLGGEITIGGTTKFITDILSDTESNVATADSNWSASNSTVSYTAWNPDVTDAWAVTLRAAATDFTSPTISSSSVSNITSSGATINWTTNEAATSQVEYGLTTFYAQGISSFNVTLSTNHSVVLTGLVSGTTYHYREKTRDAAGNIKLGTDKTFTTL